jgi:hypothetical protein
VWKRLTGACLRMRKEPGARSPVEAWRMNPFIMSICEQGRGGPSGPNGRGGGGPVGPKGLYVLMPVYVCAYNHHDI